MSHRRAIEAAWRKAGKPGPEDLTGWRRIAAMLPDVSEAHKAEAMRALDLGLHFQRLKGPTMRHPDDEYFHYSTDSEWDRAEAYQLGADRPDLAWVCTDRDVWHANPFYVGPPRPHPESYDADAQDDSVEFD